MQPNSEMAHSVCHAFSTEVACYFHISTDKVRGLIEQGPPEELVATFHKLFGGEIKETKSAAVQAATRYGLLPGLIEWSTTCSAVLKKLRIRTNL